MEQSHMFFNALGYVALIVLSGLALLFCLILFIIRISQDHKQKWNWLAGSVLSVLCLLFSVYLFTRKVVTTVKNFGNVVESKMEETIEEIKKQDSSYHYTFLQTNQTVKLLKDFEHMNSSYSKDEFYVYYGYMDYYRMPLTFPFSIHCNDVLETGSLFNEKNVTEFNINDNGEISCGLEGIESFAFDNSVLITQIKTVGKMEYVVYEFSSEKKVTQNNLKEALKTARKQFNYRGYDTLISIKDYYSLFN